MHSTARSASTSARGLTRWEKVKAPPKGCIAPLSNHTPSSSSIADLDPSDLFGPGMAANTMGWTSTQRLGVLAFRRSGAAVPRRFNSTSSGPSTSASPGKAPKAQGLNQPKAIFWGWTALTVVAGYGYFTVKSNNTAKKRDFMIKQGQEQQRQRGADGAEGAASTPVLMSSSNQEKHAQSPLQSLAAAFNRQTTQRSRNAESSNGGSE